jgi:hypothetical protein
VVVTQLCSFLLQAGPGAVPKPEYLATLRRLREAEPSTTGMLRQCLLLGALLDYADEVRWKGDYHNLLHLLLHHRRVAAMHRPRCCSCCRTPRCPQTWSYLPCSASPVPWAAARPATPWAASPL